MTSSPLLVTGASGHLGRLVLEYLIQEGRGPLIATSRSPEALASFAARGVEVRRADFDDEASLLPAFRGAKRALLISTDALLEPGLRVRQHTTAIRALSAAGIEQVVYTSLANAASSVVGLAKDHAETEAALSNSDLGFTILGNTVYADLELAGLPRALASGNLINARGDGKIAFVTRDDCAHVAAAALADENFRGRRTLNVTGPEALSSNEFAAVASACFERPLKHVSIPLEALVAGMIEHGLPERLARIYASFDTAAARGEFAEVTDTVRSLTGRAPQSMRDLLMKNRSLVLAQLGA